VTIAFAPTTGPLPSGMPKNAPNYLGVKRNLRKLLMDQSGS
jgi:hypothetical protein